MREANEYSALKAGSLTGGGGYTYRRIHLVYPRGHTGGAVFTRGSY